MKAKQLDLYQSKSLKKYIVAIIALIAVIGFFNRSIGSFVTYTFYYLFGTAAPLFFIFVVIACFAFYNRISAKQKRFYFLLTSFILSVVTLAALLYQYTYPNGGFEVLTPSLVRLINYSDFYLNPNYIFEQIHGGVVGGFIYAGLFTLGGRLFAIIVIVILLVTALVFAFWPLITAIFKSIKVYLVTLRHRNKVIRDARKIPLSQTISPLKKDASSTNENDNQQGINYFGNQLEASSVKRAVFGGETSQDSFTFSPVVVDISKASRTNTQEINIDDILHHVQSPLPLVAEPVNNKTEDLNAPLIPNNQVSRNVNEQEEQPRILEKIYQQELIFDLDEIETPMTKPEVHLEQEQEHKTKVEETPKPLLPLEEIQAPIKEIVKEPVKEVVVEKETAKPKPETKTVKKEKKYVYPSIELLNGYTPEDEMIINNRAAEVKMQIINATFNSFNLGAQAVSYTIGPSITRFDIKMADDKSVTTINRYINDLNIRLKGQPGRFEEIVSGRVTSGFEVPNEKKVPVTLKDCINELPKGEKQTFAVPFGKNIDGRVIWGLLDEFPHLLVAGSTGSGKSVFVHSVLVTLLMRTTPEELKLLIIDPKRVEMNKYKEIPHLLCPIVKEARDARVALEKLVEEMNQRYRMFEEASANKISEYNSIAKRNGEKILPRIVVVIDEYADLTESEKDISTYVLSLAQKSRAAGIHMIVATQRPSSTVITGQIKANLPTRVALMTASPIDSTVILGQGGAEQLLGNGDMLVDCTQISRQGFTRIQGAYVDNDEIRAVTDYLKETYDTDYVAEFLDLSDRGSNGFISGTPSTYKDELYEDVKTYVLSLDTISINRIQTSFNMSYNRAKMIYDMLMAEGVITPPDAANSSRGALVIHDYELSPEEIRIDNNDY